MDKPNSKESIEATIFLGKIVPEVQRNYHEIIYLLTYNKALEYNQYFKKRSKEFISRLSIEDLKTIYHHFLVFHYMETDHIETRNIKRILEMKKQGGII